MHLFKIIRASPLLFLLFLDVKTNTVVLLTVLFLCCNYLSFRNISLSCLLAVAFVTQDILASQSVCPTLYPVMTGHLQFFECSCYWKLLWPWISTEAYSAFPQCQVLLPTVRVFLYGYFFFYASLFLCAINMMHTAMIFPAEQIGQIFGIDLSSLQKNLLIRLQIKFTKLTPKPTNQQNKYGHNSLQLIWILLRWRAMTRLFCTKLP